MKVVTSPSIEFKCGSCGAVCQGAPEEFRSLHTMPPTWRAQGPFGDGDSKSWTEVVLQKGDKASGEDVSIAFCVKTFEMLAAVARLKLTVLPVRSDDVDKVREALQAPPWAHTMSISKQGAQA